jgi:hypothetical protein
MMIQYSPYSGITVRQRIERSYKAKRKHDPVVTVHNNGTSEGTLFWFYLSDWPDFDKYKELDYRLDTESKSTDRLTLGINFSRVKPLAPESKWG